MDWSLVEFLSVPTILLVTIVLPLWLIFYYITKWKAMKQTGQAEPQALGDVWATARRLEARIKALETVLDAEAPGWRNKQ